MIWSGAGHFLCPSMRFSPPEWKVNALTNVLLSYHLFLISGGALYTKFQGNRNSWPVYLLDSQYGVDAEKLWVKVTAKSDYVMFTSAWPKWKEDSKKRKWSKSRKSMRKK